MKKFGPYYYVEYNDDLRLWFVWDGSHSIDIYNHELVLLDVINIDTTFLILRDVKSKIAEQIKIEHTESKIDYSAN